MKKKFLVSILVLPTVFLLAGCTNASPTPVDTNTPTPTETSTVSDADALWNSSVTEGQWGSYTVDSSRQVAQDFCTKLPTMTASDLSNFQASAEQPQYVPSIEQAAVNVYCPELADTFATLQSGVGTGGTDDVAFTQQLKNTGNYENINSTIGVDTAIKIAHAACDAKAQSQDALTTYVNGLATTYNDDSLTAAQNSVEIGIAVYCGTH